MPFRPDQHAQAVARRLELLSAELAPPPLPDPFDLHTGLRISRTDEPAEPAEPVEPMEPVEPVDGGLIGLRADLEPPLVPRPGRHAARRGLEAGWLPEALRGRIALGPAQIAVVAVVLAVGLAASAWWVLRAQPEPVAPVPVDTPLISPVAEPDGSASTPTELVVDVAGRVRRPGIVVLEPGARVVDALKAAGGAAGRVDLTSLNLARQVVDGEQILVGVAAPPGLAASAATNPPAPGAPGSLVNINTASQAALEELPGVGPVTAAAIIAFRTEQGAFSAVDQLLDVSGIGEATLAEIAPHVTV
jgi:competence protein ComEA